MTQHDQSSAPPDAILMQMLFGAQMQRSICVATKLGIAELLAERPQTADELAAKTDSFRGQLRGLATEAQR